MVLVKACFNILGFKMLDSNKGKQSDLGPYCLQYIHVCSTLVKSVYQKNNLLTFQPNICCGYSKEPSQ